MPHIILLFFDFFKPFKMYKKFLSLQGMHRQVTNLFGFDLKGIVYLGLKMGEKGIDRESEAL